MGFDINGAKLLIKSQQLGVNFENTVMLGRQTMYLKTKDFGKILKESGLVEQADDLIVEEKYAEPFLKLLGAKQIDSIDASDYENASIVHDFNKAIDKKYHANYSLFIDGGSLEHIFNFPVAIQNSMNLIKEGGYYIGITPTNNFFGHGFYQFSPELYYRIFNESNGFKVLKMYFYVSQGDTSFYEVADPLQVKERVVMINSYPSYLFVIAKKEKTKELFEVSPQQSDYEHNVWGKKKVFGSAKGAPQWRVKLARIKRKLKKLKQNYTLISEVSGLNNPSYIKKVEIDIRKKNR